MFNQNEMSLDSKLNWFSFKTDKLLIASQQTHIYCAFVSTYVRVYVCLR